MSKTYILEVEVAGGIGPRTKMDQSVHPPRVSLLHYVFDDWFGDQIVEGFPCYMVTENLAKSLESAGVTGFKLAEARVGISSEFKELCPKRTLPIFKWLQIVGNRIDSDMYMTPDHRLAVSQRAFDVIMATKPECLEYEEA